MLRCLKKSSKSILLDECIKHFENSNYNTTNLMEIKQLNVLKDTTADNQRCNARGCRQCPLTNDKQKIIINDQFVRILRHLSCKSKHVIYMWICKLCEEKDAYFGRTIQECHNRTSGHRGAFTEEKWDKSALSMHAWVPLSLWTSSRCPSSKKYPLNT